MDKVKQASKRLSVTIPKGVDDGTRIRLSGKGEAGSRGGSSGDLYLFINVHSHDLFKRSDENLFFECPVSIADAALGTSIEIPTIDGGKAKIKIPAGTQSGKQFRLRGKGMPYMRGSDFGDLYVQVNTEVPISLNKEQKELLEKFREIENEKSNPSIKILSKGQKFLEKLANSANLDPHKMGKINLAITGCMGRMGQQLIKSVIKDKSTKLVALTENRLISKKINGIKPELNTEKLS